MGGLGLGLALTGLLAGPSRQRADPTPAAYRPALLGRVMAVSMSLNMAGFPLAPPWAAACDMVAAGGVRRGGVGLAAGGSGDVAAHSGGDG